MTGPPMTIPAWRQVPTGWAAVLRVVEGLWTWYRRNGRATVVSSLLQPLLMLVAFGAMTPFSGTFFPISQLPRAIQPLAWISPLWHGTEPARGAALGTLQASSSS
jgi:hypothetical protein